MAHYQTSYDELMDGPPALAGSGVASIEELCLECQHLLTTKGSNSHLWKIGSNAQCRFCSFFRSLIQLTGKVIPTTLTSTLRWRLDSINFRNLNQHNWEFIESGALEPFQIKIVVQYGPAPTPIDIPIPDRLWEPNSDPHHFDATSARLWLTDCESKHKKCKISRGLPALLPGTLLIDVISNQLVPASINARYITLSYVWGNATSFQTTKANLASLKKAGGLLTTMNSVEGLPRVVNDAILAVRGLGERFLWVDSLCIVQDDLDGKGAQIGQMDVIYSRAVLALVALSGKHANSRLFDTMIGKKVLRRTNSFHVQAPEIMVWPCYPALSTLQEYSLYNSRGWTFQESILSSRCIYFTDYGAFYACNKFSIHESGIQASPLITTSELLCYRTNELNPWRHEKDSALSDDMLGVYIDLVEQYTERHLKYESDRFNAIAGILAAIGRQASWNYFHGLPRNRFVAALLWTASPSSVHRSDLSVQFPSWSWLSWTGPVFYSPIRELQSQYWNLKSEIKGLYPGWMRSVFSLPLSLSLSKTIQEQITVKKQGMVICFSAFVADSQRFQLELDDLSQTDTIIFDNQEQRCGSLYNTNIRSISRTHDDPLDLVLIARMGPPKALGRLDVTETEHVVMLIRWDGPVAQRVAVGRMQCSSWQRMKASRKTIILI